MRPRRTRFTREYVQNKWKNLKIKPSFSFRDFLVRTFPGYIEFEGKINSFFLNHY